MSRNKYPERTVQRILDTSLRLFVEKGYENTSIQDILDDLGDLTKGAIYHHFKSKEDILLAVMDQLTAGQDIVSAETVRRSDMTGREKLYHLLYNSLSDPGQETLFRTMPSLLENPRLFALLVKSVFEDSVPDFMLPIIEQGVADGSIPTRHPKQLAEVILLLINVWINPMVHRCGPEELEQRFQFFGRMMEGLGLDLLDDRLLEGLRVLHKSFSHQSGGPAGAD